MYAKELVGQIVLRSHPTLKHNFGNYMRNPVKITNVTDSHIYLEYSSGTTAIESSEFFDDKWVLYEPTPTNPKGKTTCMYDIPSGDLIATFANAKIAAVFIYHLRKNWILDLLKFNVEPHVAHDQSIKSVAGTIRKACSGISTSAYGFDWRYGE